MYFDRFAEVLLHLSAVIRMHGSRATTALPNWCLTLISTLQRCGASGRRFVAWLCGCEPKRGTATESRLCSLQANTTAPTQFLTTTAPAPLEALHIWISGSLISYNICGESEPLELVSSAVSILCSSRSYSSRMVAHTLTACLLDVC